MLVTGLFLVRNEADIIEANLRHHLASGVDRAVVVDNGSTDGTDRIVQRLSKRLPISWTREPGAYNQSQITTELARDAARSGADWVVPIDADEIWTGSDGHSIRSVLEESGAGIVQVPVINFVQRREQLTTSRSCLSTMTMRVAEQVGPPEACEQLVETGRIGFVEMMYTPKCVSRAVADIHIRAGNHLVEGVPGDAVLTDRLACLHAPLRSRSVLETKVEQGRRVAEASFLPGEAWHVHRWRRLAAEGALDEEWRANSYRDAALDVGDHRRPLVRDTRLADAVAPWTRRARWRR